MTPEQLATWRQLADAATPEPWKSGVGNIYKSNGGVLVGGISEQAHADAAFGAAAREAVPALLDEVERLTAELKAKITVDETEWIRVSEYVKLRRRLAEYERNADYISSVIDSEGVYRP
jgi:hypothetical protein